MAFRPINPRNAIVEAIVMVHFTRPIFDFEAEAIRGLRDEFSADLPRFEAPPSGATFVMQGPAASGPPLTSVVPFSFASYQRDGALETRILVNGNVIVVNFLVYSRWTELQPKAVAWIKACLGKIADVQRPDTQPPFVDIITHQIIDVFLWEGSSFEVATSDMMVSKPERLPDAAWAEVGQPWFAAHSSNTPFPSSLNDNGRILDFVTFDLSEDQQLGWRLRVENTLEARFGSQKVGTALFHEDEAAVVLDTLHRRNQNLIRSMLKPDLLAKIGMGE